MIASLMPIAVVYPTTIRMSLQTPMLPTVYHDTIKTESALQQRVGLMDSEPVNSMLNYIVFQTV
jgi:hypothetical protein